MKKRFVLLSIFILMALSGAGLADIGIYARIGNGFGGSVSSSSENRMHVADFGSTGLSLASSSTSPSVTLYVSPSSATTNINFPATFVGSVGAQNGFTGTVNLSITTSSDLACGFVNGGGTQDSIDLTPTGPPVYLVSFSCLGSKVGTYDVTITASAPAGIMPAPETITVMVQTSLNFLNSWVTASPLYGPAPLTVHFTVTATGVSQFYGDTSFSYCWIVHGTIPSWQVSGGFSYTTEQNPVAILTQPGIYYFYQSTNRQNLVIGTPKCTPAVIALTGALLNTPNDESYSSGFILVGPGSYNSAIGTVSPTYGVAPLTVSLSLSNCQGQCANNNLWSFGDETGSGKCLLNGIWVGCSAGGPSITHTYTQPGVYWIGNGTIGYCPPFNCNSFANSTTNFARILVGSPTPILSAQASSNVSTGQVPLSVKFSGSAVGGTLLSRTVNYNWGPAMPPPLKRTSASFLRTIRTQHSLSLKPPISELYSTSTSVSPGTGPG